MRVIKVELWAFQDGAVREVRILDEATGTEDSILNANYHYGQNDIQPVPGRCSVSMGDVILLDQDSYLVVALGFHKMFAAEYEGYKLLTRPQRVSFLWGLGLNGEPTTEGQS